MKLIDSIKNNAPTILSVVGVAGLVGTTISAIKETPKVDQMMVNEEVYHNRDCTALEKAWIYTKGYKYTILLGGTTAICILGSNALNKKQQAELTGAYVALGNMFQKYRNRVEELYGEEIEKSIMDTAKTRTIVNNKTGDVYELEEPELFYDPYTDNYFQTTMREFDRVRYELNRKYAVNGTLTINDFYAELGLPKVDNGHELGWSDAIDRETMGYTWLDIGVEYEALPQGSMASYLESTDGDYEYDMTDVPKGAYVIDFGKTPTVNYKYE